MSAPKPTTLTGKPNINQPWEDFETVLRTAERARAAGDHSRAHTFFARVVELNPKDPRGWVGMAITAPSLDERIISWGYALAIMPDSWEARVQLDAFIEERIAQSGISDAPVLIALGRTLAEVSQRPAAQRLLSRATELDPTNLEGWLWRAGVSDDPNQVIQCLQRALALDPENAQAKAGLSWVLEKQTSTRAPVSEPALTAARDSIQEGQFALQAGNLAQAHLCFKRATELDPHNDIAWYWRGSTAPAIVEALNCIEQSLKLNPQNQSARDARAWLRVKKYRAQIRPSASAQPTPSPPETPKPRQRRIHPLVILVLLSLVMVTLFLVTQLARALG